VDDDAVTNEQEYDQGLLNDNGPYESGLRLSDFRDSAGVVIPIETSILKWSEPSLLNAASIREVLSGNALEEPLLPSFIREIAIASTLTRRSPLQILEFSDSDDGTLVCRPQAHLSLRLDELLGAARDDFPSQVWKCSILSRGNSEAVATVVLKLLTDQNDKLPSHLYIPREEYEKVHWGKPHQGRSAQKCLCCEADALKALSALQGFCVPFSYGFYSVSPCSNRLLLLC
jgi:hypothetical protein